jgi:hypothetical protein
LKPFSKAFQTNFVGNKMELSKRVSETEKGHGHTYPKSLFNEPAEICEVFHQKKRNRY